MIKNNRSKNIRPTLGAVAISHNEEQDLPMFLEGLVHWMDEIVIVDDSSTDSTVQMIKDAGPQVKVVEQVRDSAAGGFARQRNRGIAEATSEWLLHMDIDERVPPALAEEIREAITRPGFNGFCYRRLNFFLNRAMKGGDLRDWNKPQLARRGRHRFIGTVHEACLVDEAPDAVGQLDNMMWHLNDDSYRERMQKSFRYCLELSNAIVENKKSVHWFHLLLLPIREFVRQFILKRGFLDGMPGLIWALHAATAKFQVYVLAWDQQNPVNRSQVESQLLQKWKLQNKRYHENP